jgi:hypothetical protein
MARAQVLLRIVLNAGSNLRDHVEDGLGALTQAHRTLIAQAERPTVGDSLDLDSATKAQYPQANRWDYLLSVPQHRHLIAIESHAAKDSEVSVVIAKKQQSLAHLANHLPPAHRVARWIWVSSGRVGFSRMDKAIRSLDQKGIEFAGKFVRSLA